MDLIFWFGSLHALKKEFSILLQACANHINKWPLRITFKKVSPNTQNGEAKCGRVAIWNLRGICRVSLKFNSRISLINNTPYPM